MLDCEILVWTAKTSDKEQIELEIQGCAETIRSIQQIWEDGEDEDWQGVAQDLIEEMVFDLDISSKLSL